MYPSFYVSEEIFFHSYSPQRILCIREFCFDFCTRETYLVLYGLFSTKKSLITLEDEPLTKRKQSSLTSFFSGSTNAVKKPDNVNKTMKKRTQQTETAEKCKTTSLVQHDAENWFSINLTITRSL